jgi:hypothetical protein
MNGFWILFLSSIPAGYLIAWLARAEVRIGRKWLERTVIVLSVGAMIAWGYGTARDVLLMLWVAMVAGISYHVSFAKTVRGKQKV